MFNGLFNGPFGNNEANKALDDHKQLESRYTDALRRSSMNEAQKYQAMLEQARAQQQAMMNRGMSGSAYTQGSGGLGQGYQAARGFITIDRSDYDELQHLHHWCKNTYPEIYEEWCAMRDLERVSKDEST